jgi:hypothetical protein
MENKHEKEMSEQQEAPFHLHLKMLVYALRDQVGTSKNGYQESKIKNDEQFGLKVVPSKH